MPANSGSITGTVAHTHGSPSSDGGHLLATTTGMSGTTTGSMVYYDASSVAQNLGIGAAGETLTVSGGLPAWGAGGASAAFELISEDELGADAADFHHTWTAIDFNDYSMVRVIFQGWIVNAGTDLKVQLQNPALTANSYVSQRFNVTGGTLGDSEQTNTAIVYPVNARNYMGTMDIIGGYNAQSDNKYLRWQSSIATTGSNSWCFMAGYYEADTNIQESTGIKYIPAGGNIKAGWVSTAYKYSRT